MLAVANTGMDAFLYENGTIAACKYFQYRLLAAHMFTWYGLPPGLSTERLELMIIDHGKVGWFDCLEGQYILPMRTIDGGLNVYGDEMTAIPVPLNSTQLHPKDVIPRLLYDNALRRNFNAFLHHFAQRIGEIHKSITISERLARLTSIIRVDKDSKEDMARMQSMIDEGYPIVYIDNAMNTEAISVYNTGFSSDVFHCLWESANKIDGEAMAFLGTIYNVQQNKAAGVGAAETLTNYASTFAMANGRLKQRQDWCEKLISEGQTEAIWCVKTNDFGDIMHEVLQNGNTSGLPQSGEGIAMVGDRVA